VNPLFYKLVQGVSKYLLHSFCIGPRWFVLPYSHFLVTWSIFLS